jgi:hypothetical protein
MSLILTNAFSFSIYGDDDRVDYYQINNKNIQKLTDSIATRIAVNDISVTNNSYTLKNKEFGFIHQLCNAERFSKQNTAGDCTGFLISENKLVTAGHCVQNNFDCKNSYWLFDYKMKNEADKLIKGSTRNLFKCKKIINKKVTYLKNNSKGADIDVAIVELDRKTSRAALTLSRGRVLQGQDLMVLGHPKGLPLKMANNATALSLRKNSFYSNLDTYSGNSGSPVFNEKTLEVVGVLTAGKMDFRATRAYGGDQCQFSALYKNNPNTAETVNYIQNIFGLKK